MSNPSGNNPNALAIVGTSRDHFRYHLRYIWLISLVAALGGLLFGYDWVVIGGAKPFFERYFGLTGELVRGWANSCALLGCLVGSLMAGTLSDRFGRKRLLVFCATLFAVTSLGNAFAPNFSIFVLWRILGGTAIGLASNLSPMYIAEIAPARMRGRLVSINQLTIVLGILLAQFINWWIARDLPHGASEAYMAQSWYVTTGWRWMFGLTAVPALIFFFGMFMVPESPRWLAKNGDRVSAHSVLARIGDEHYATRVLDEIESTLDGEKGSNASLGDLFAPGMPRVLLLGVVLAVFQQWCGINVIFNYAEEIFQAAGYDIADVLKNIAWTGSVNLVFTFVALGVVDRGLVLFYRHPRPSAAAAGACGDRLLRHVVGARDLGGDFRNISQSGPGHSHGHCRHVALAGLFHSYLYLPVVEHETWLGWNILALCRNLPGWLFLYLFASTGDQGQDTGRN